MCLTGQDIDRLEEIVKSQESARWRIKVLNKILALERERKQVDEVTDAVYKAIIFHLRDLLKNEERV